MPVSLPPAALTTIVLNPARLKLPLSSTTLIVALYESVSHLTDTVVLLAGIPAPTETALPVPPSPNTNGLFESASLCPARPNVTLSSTPELFVALNAVPYSTVRS